MKRLGLDESRELAVLLVDGDAADRTMVGKTLVASGLKASVIEVEDLSHALVELERQSFDVVIAEYFLPETDPLELVASMRRVTPLLPIVFVTRRGDQELAATIMRTGGAEYLSKVGLTPLQLVHSLRSALAYARAQRVKIEKQRELEEKSAELARNLEDARAATRARDDVLAIVSHDLRSPLNVVSMSASMLDERSSDARVKPLVVKIHRAVTRMNRRIEDLLDAARIDAGSMSVDAHPVLATDLIDQALAEQADAARAKGVELRRGDLEAGLKVKADRGRVAQVLGNLLANAVKFTPRGGHVDVASNVDGEDMPAFVVSDSGVGIPEELLPRLFQRYWHDLDSKYGAGLGLYIADGIVRAHGGRMSVQSTLGAGSQFTFWLPRATPRAS